jgi:hypothetical protein
LWIWKLYYSILHWWKLFEIIQCGSKVQVMSCMLQAQAVITGESSRSLKWESAQVLEICLPLKLLVDSDRGGPEVIWLIVMVKLSYRSKNSSVPVVIWLVFSIFFRNLTILAHAVRIQIMVVAKFYDISPEVNIWSG